MESSSPFVPHSRHHFPAEDFPAEDFPAEDFPAEDFPAEDFPAEDFLAEDFPAEVGQPRLVSNPPGMPLFSRVSRDSSDPIARRSLGKG
ncbi:MAG: hypothetical protein ACK6DS_10375 [Planctomycetota bacterium]